MKPYTKRQTLELLRSELNNEYSSFKSHHEDLARYVLPRRGRFFQSDTNRGERRNQNIIDSTATSAAKTLRSGMHAGITSPARPWFRLTTNDQEANEHGQTKYWLHDVTKRMNSIFFRSNLYKTLPIIYGDLGLFSVAAMLVERDPKKLLRFKALPIGSYRIANDAAGNVNTFLREFRMTVAQVVEMFGIKDDKGHVTNWEENFSSQVKNLYEQGNLQAWIDIIHIIRPNENFRPGALGAKYKLYESCYYEQGFVSGGNGIYLTSGDYGKFLRESGYDYFPVLAPRWELAADDIYGTDCPGMTSLGDIKALQLMHKRKAQAIEYKLKPPLKGHSSLRQKAISSLPADVTFVGDDAAAVGLAPIYQVNFDISELKEDIYEHQQRIKDAFFTDLFKKMLDDDRSGITATEVREIKEEKLLMLGPVMEQLNGDLLDPLIDITFFEMSENGLVPEAPEELQGQPLKVEYLSIMSQAQKLVGASYMDNFLNLATRVIQIDPSAAVKINTQQIIDEAAEIFSTPPSIVRTDEEVEAIEAAQAQAAQAQRMAEQIPAMAGAAKTLSETDVDKPSALQQVMGG